jgi:hypothetical protein
MITIFGYQILTWVGLFAALFIFSAVTAVFMGKRHRWLIKGRWHHRFALIGTFFAVIHVILAVLQVFFRIYI